MTYSYFEEPYMFYVQLKYTTKTNKIHAHSDTDSYKFDYIALIFPFKLHEYAIMNSLSKEKNDLKHKYNGFLTKIEDESEFTSN